LPPPRDRSPGISLRRAGKDAWHEKHPARCAVAGELESSPHRHQLRPASNDAASRLTTLSEISAFPQDVLPLPLTLERPQVPLTGPDRRLPARSGRPGKPADARRSPSGVASGRIPALSRPPHALNAPPDPPRFPHTRKQIPIRSPSVPRSFRALDAPRASAPLSPRVIALLSPNIPQNNLILSPRQTPRRYMICKQKVWIGKRSYARRPGRKIPLASDRF